MPENSSMMQAGSVIPKWFYPASGAFIMGGILAWIYQFPAFFALPVIIAIGAIAVSRLDILLWISAALVPISVNFNDFFGGLGLQLPTEPLIILMMALGILKYVVEGNYPRSVLYHPVSIILMLHLLWMLIAALFSSMPIVSLKYWLMRFWYCAVFYYLAAPLFLKIENLRRYFFILVLPLTAVVLYVVIRHAQFGFTREIFNYVNKPFFDNHGIYSAMLSFFVPGLLLLAFYGKKLNYSIITRGLLLALAALFAFSITYSFTRAAWLSLIAAAGAMVVLLLRVPVKLIFGTIGISLVMVVVFQQDILMQLGKNKQGSSNKNNLEDHLQSSSNIRNDPSNLERLNRWNCALRMFKERPVTGWGPGTFAFQYAPFQMRKDLTVISTNFGDVGHAHSEYLGPLAEEGLPGMLLWMAFFLVTLYRGVMLYYRAEDEIISVLALVFVLGLVTYYIHGALNSYIDYDKVAVPLFSFTAAVVSLDIVSSARKNYKRNENTSTNK